VALAVPARTCCCAGLQGSAGCALPIGDNRCRADTAKRGGEINAYDLMPVSRQRKVNVTETAVLAPWQAPYWLW